MSFLYNANFSQTSTFLIWKVPRCEQSTLCNYSHVWITFFVSSDQTCLSLANFHVKYFLFNLFFSRGSHQRRTYVQSWQRLTWVQLSWLPGLGGIKMPSFLCFSWEKLSMFPGLFRFSFPPIFLLRVKWFRFSSLWNGIFECSSWIWNDCAYTKSSILGSGEVNVNEFYTFE